jgi:hypothetical protein
MIAEERITRPAIRFQLVQKTLEDIAAQFQAVTADVRFLTASEGGRRKAVDLFDLSPTDGVYRPHIVVPDESSREQTTGTGPSEGRVAATFFAGPPDYKNGDWGQFRFFCPYWKNPMHPKLIPGTEFSILEGAQVVAHGRIVHVAEPPFDVEGFEQPASSQ